MAATPEARRLTEAHRLAQARLGAQTVQAMATVWPLLDPRNLDGTVERWLTASLLVVGAQRSRSARLAANYLTTFKILEFGAAARSVPLVLADIPAAAAVTTSLMVTGPMSLRSALARGVQPAVAADVAQARTAASAMRHALNGGRETTIASVRADSTARGWRRVTSGDPCSFCSMLASRGAVYGAGSGSFHAHDSCGCSAEPVYR